MDHEAWKLQRLVRRQVHRIRKQILERQVIGVGGARKGANSNHPAFFFSRDLIRAFDDCAPFKALN